METVQWNEDAYSSYAKIFTQFNIIASYFIAKELISVNTESRTCFISKQPNLHSRKTHAVRKVSAGNLKH